MGNYINRIMQGEQINCYSDNYPSNYYNIRYSNQTGMFIEKEYHNGALIETLSLNIEDVQSIIETSDHIHIK